MMDSATEIVRFPRGGYLVSADMREEPLSIQARIKSKKMRL